MAVVNSLLCARKSQEVESRRVRYPGVLEEIEFGAGKECMEPYGASDGEFQFPMVGSDAPPTPAFAVGDEIVLNTSVGGEIEVERWKKRGFTVVESADDEVFLRFHGNSETAAGSETVDSEVITLSSGFVEEERESPSSPESPTVFKGQYGEESLLVWETSVVKTSSDDLSWKVPGRDQKPYAFVLFKSACDRHTSPDGASLKLQLFQVHFGIPNCLNDENNKGHFIYELDVTVTPLEQWRNRVHHMFANPADDAHQDVVNKQRSQSVGLSIDPRSSAQISASVSSSISQDFYKHGWMPATVDPLDTRSVTWTWRISLWEDGQGFRPERPNKVKWGPFPNLPVNPQHVQLINPQADATWEVPKAEMEFVTEVKWDVRLRLHTAFVRQDSFMESSLVYHRRKAEQIQFTLDAQVSANLEAGLNFE